MTGRSEGLERAAYDKGFRDGFNGRPANNTWRVPTYMLAYDRGYQIGRKRGASGQ